MNRSEELCKLLGIEPQIIEGSCSKGSTCSKVGGGCKHCTVRTECFIYPDLTKPNNFVKLLKLMSEQFGAVEIFTEEETIEGLVNSLNQGLFPNFKYKAQATKWDY